MWIITKRGFISVVEHEEVTDWLLVRARREEDIRSAFPEAEIEEHPTADYQWRAIVGRNEVAGFVAAQVFDVDYTSHAKEAMAGDDDERYRTYMSVWTALNKLQVDGGEDGEDDAAPTLDASDFNRIANLMEQADVDVNRHSHIVYDELEDVLRANGYDLVIDHDGRIYNLSPEDGGEPVGLAIELDFDGVVVVDEGENEDEYEDEDYRAARRLFGRSGYEPKREIAQASDLRDAVRGVRNNMEDPS